MLQKRYHEEDCITELELDIMIDFIKLEVIHCNREMDTAELYGQLELLRQMKEVIKPKGRPYRYDISSGTFLNIYGHLIFVDVASSIIQLQKENDGMIIIVQRYQKGAISHRPLFPIRDCGKTADEFIAEYKKQLAMAYQKYDSKLGEILGYDNPMSIYYRGKSNNERILNK